MRNVERSSGFHARAKTPRARAWGSSDHRRRSLHWRHPPDSIHFGCVVLVNVNEDWDTTLCRVDQIALQIKDEKA
jgi:hypothetical protein